MIIKGTDLMVFLQDPGTGNYKSIGYATSHTLTVGSNTTEISTKDSGGGKWVEQNVNKLNWSMSTENLFSLEGEQEGHSFDDLFKYMVNRQTVDLVFALESTWTIKPDTVPVGGWTPVTAPQYKGQAYITDLSVNAPDGDNASFSATFTGNGKLELIEPAP
jgi:TP901-1 family phage major tail protein